MLSAVVAVLCKAGRLVIFSDIDGLYEQDPRLHPDAKLIERIDKISDSIYSLAGGAGSRRGTGGMRTKLQAAAPYFDHYAERLATYFDERVYRPERLWDLNSDLTRLLLELTGLPEIVPFTEDYTAPAPLDAAAAAGDFREIISHKPRLRRSDPTFRPPTYYQVFSDRIPFAPNLSVVDLLFCEGPQAGRVIRESIVNV